VIDWGSALIMPGLVNAHTHLELSGLGGRIAQFDSFADWLRQLVQLRRGLNPADLREAVTRGIELSLRAGTTLVGDISASGPSWECLRQSPVRKVVFEEVVGLSEGAAAAQTERLRRLLGT